MLDHFNNEYVYLFDMFVVILLLKIRKYQYERLMVVSKKKNDTHSDYCQSCQHDNARCTSHLLYSETQRHLQVYPGPPLDPS